MFLDFRFLDAADEEHCHYKQQERKSKGQTAIQAGKPSGQIAEGGRKGDGGGHYQSIETGSFLRIDIELEQGVFTRIHKRGSNSGTNT